MIRKTVAAALLSLTAISAAHAQPAAPAAAPAASATAAKYTTADTDLGTLLDDPAAKAILVKHLPALVANPQLEQGRSMTLKQLQAYAGDTVTDEVLVKIDADLAKLPK
ncbi:MAG: hypothetical protein ABIQ81_09555 [Novosphingobium sp.]